MANGERGFLDIRRERAARPRLSLEQIEAIAERESPGILQTLGNILSFPGDVVRGGARSLIAGEPFQRTTARQLLDTLGIEPEAEFTLEPGSTGEFLEGLAAGTGVLATDILTDPLSALAGIGQLGKGAKALRGAQSAVRTGRTIRRGAREAVEDVARDIPPELIDEATRLGAQIRQTPEEILEAGGIPRPTDLGPLRRASEIGVGREATAENFARARELFEEAERLGTARPGGLRGLISEIPAGAGTRPRGFENIRTVREGFQAPVGAPGARDLLQVGLPGGPRVRVPLPRTLERAVGGTAAAIGAPFGRGIQRVLGRSGLVSDELARAEAFLARRSESVKGIQERSILAREEELLTARAAEQGLDPEEITDAFRDEFRIDIRDAREGNSRLRDPIEQEFADALNTMVDARTFAQQRRGARGDDLLEEYAERILTKEGRQLLRQRDLMDPYKEFLRGRFDAHVVRGVREGSQRRRSDYLPELTTDANEFFRTNGLQGDFFSLDPSFTVSQAIATRSLSTIHANLIQSFVGDVSGIPGRAGDVSLPAFLQRMKMTGFGNARWARGASDRTIEDALLRAGVNPDTTLPFEAAKEFEDVMGLGFANIQPAALNDFIRKVYDPLNSLYRVAVTAPFPAFHIRNMLSNTILNFMGGVRDPGSYVEAGKVLARTNPALAKRTGVAFDQKLADELTELGVLQGGQLQRILREAQERGADIPQGALEGALNFARNNRVSKAGFEFGQYVEDYSRLAHYLSKRGKGLSKQEAVASVNKFLFDYSNRALTGMERGVLNRLFFFYRWNRFAIPMVLRTLFEHPNRAAVVVKATTQPGVERPTGVPEFLRESAGIPVGVDPTTGETSFVSRFGSPFESLEFFDPTGAQEPGILGQLQKGGREVAQQLVPPLRIVLEAIAGEEFFLGRKISELDKVPAIQALIGEATGVEAIGEEVLRAGGPQAGVRFRGSPQLRFLLRNLPTSRVTQTASRLLEQPATAVGEATGLLREGVPRRGQRGIGQELLRSVAGVSITEVDTAEEAKRQAQRVLSRELDARRLTGEAGRLPIFTATQKGKASREVEELLRQLRRVNEARPQVRGTLPAGQR